MARGQILWLPVRFPFVKQRAFPLRWIEFRDFAPGIFTMSDLSANPAERAQMVEALRRSEERSRMLWQRNLAGVFRISLDGRILDCNDSFARMFGYLSREDMLQHSSKEFYFDLGVREEFLTRLRVQRQLSNYEL